MFSLTFCILELVKPYSLIYLKPEKNTPPFGRRLSLHIGHYREYLPGRAACLAVFTGKTIFHRQYSIHFQCYDSGTHQRYPFRSKPLHMGHYKEYPRPPIRGAACPVLVVFTGKTIFHCACRTIFIDTILWHASLASITVEDPLRAQKLVHVHLH